VLKTPFHADFARFVSFGAPRSSVPAPLRAHSGNAFASSISLLVLLLLVSGEELQRMGNVTLERHPHDC
jgi:hypothetical protein